MNKKGFTLVEMLLVVVIIGIITALTMPGFISSISESNARKEEHLTTLIKQELDMLNKDVGEYDFWYEETRAEVDLLKTDYPEKIKKDINLEGCTIETLIVKKDGNHEVTLDCTKEE